MANLGEFQGTGYPSKPGKCFLVLGANGIRLNSNLQIDGVSVKNIAAAVLNALPVNFTGVGTFGKILDDLKGTTLQSLLNGLLNVDAAQYNQSGTFGEALNNMNARSAEMVLLRKLSQNKREIDKANNQLIFYDDDGVTVLLRINLFGEDGNPAYKNILKWEPV